MPAHVDKRHQKRINVVQELYSRSFGGTFDESADKSVKPILAHSKQLDILISSSAPKYSVSKIARVDLAILRLAVWELTVLKKEPPKVIINEAIELAKELAGEHSPAFVNAVLGKIYEKTK